MTRIKKRTLYIDIKKCAARNAHDNSWGDFKETTQGHAVFYYQQIKTFTFLFSFNQLLVKLCK